MANLQLVDTYEHGKMYKSSDSNPPYMVYVPNGVNASTQVHAYMHGAANNSTDVNKSINPIIDYLSKSDNDSVVVMYTGVSTVYKEDKAKMLLDVTYDCVNSVGGSTKNITFEGFSDGGVTAFSLTAEHLKKNPDLPPQIVVSYDSSALNYGVTKNLTGGLSESDINAYVKNGATILAFDNYKHDDELDKPMKYLTSKGIDVVYIATGHNHDHQMINSKTHYDGVYDFLDGKMTTLRNAGDYVFQRWKLNPNASDYTDGSWVNLTQVEVSSLISRSMASIILSRYGYLTGLSSIPRVAEAVSTTGDVVASDTNYVIDEVNNNRTLISNTGMLKDIGSVEFSSDTKIPVEVNSFIGDALNATGMLLEKCNSAMESLVKIGHVFEELDTDASNKVEQLGDNITTNNNDNTNTTTSGNSGTGYVSGGSSNDTVVSTSISENSTGEKTNLADTQEEMTRVNSAGEKKISNSNNIDSNNNDNTFDSITTDNNQMMYEDDSVKLIMDNDGNVECYYKIDNNDANDIIQGFKNNDMVNEVLENNDYLKVVFKKDNFNRDKFNELIESFKVYSI